MKKFILTFGVAFAAAGALLTLSTIAALLVGGSHLHGAAAQGLAILVIGPSGMVARAIGLGHSMSTWLWVSLALAANVPLWFGLGALTGALAWRLKKSSPIAQILLIAAVSASCIFVVTRLPGWFVSPSKDSCIDNLRQLEGAKAQWALEEQKMTNVAPTWDNLRPYLKRDVHCPDGGTYTIGRVDQLPSCSLPRHDSFWREAHQALE